MKNFSLLLLLITIGSSLYSQDFGLYQKKLLLTGSDTLPYRLLLPENYDASKEYPLVLRL